MVCNIIAECRCYAHAGKGNPMTNQFCASRKGAGLSKCPVDCCAGGCSGKIPFRIIPRPKPPKHVPSFRDMDMKVLLLFTVILGCIFLLLL